LVSVLVSHVFLLAVACVEELTHSSGGHYAPSIATALQSQNIKVGSVGIISPFTDVATQVPSFPVFAVNNTYGIHAYNDSVAAAALESWGRPGGCSDQIKSCRVLQDKYDPENTGLNQTVNVVCGETFAFCWGSVYGPYEMLSGRNPFDIAHTMPDSFPPVYSQGFLNNLWVRQALGVKVNYTDVSVVVAGGMLFLPPQYLRRRDTANAKGIFQPSLKWVTSSGATTKT